MSTKSFIAIFIGLILALFFALSASLVATSNVLNLRVEQLENASRSIETAERLKSMLLTHSRNTLLYSLLGDRAYLISRQEQTEQIIQNFLVMEALIANSEEEAAFESAREAVEEYLTVRRQLEESGLPPLEMYIRMVEPVERALGLIDPYIETNRTQMVQLMATINQQNRSMQIAGLWLLLAGAAILLGLFLAVIVLLTRPLTKLGQAVTRYGEGEESIRAHGSGLREIREIAANFNFMAEKLEEKRKEQLSFIASIAHDLRNPLHAIAMASQVLLLKSSEEDKPLAKTIGSQIRFLDTLVGDLLDSSRLEAGQLHLDREQTDVLPLVREAVELQKTATELHSFSLDLPSAPVVCPHDRRLLSQVLNNLLSNAVKYSPNGGTIKLRGQALTDGFSLSIIDVGIGIEAEDLHRIFKPFQRTEITRKTIPGIGLGLSASRRIMEAHGGSLTVASQPGKGSAFTLLLPFEEGVSGPRNEIKEVPGPAHEPPERPW